MNRINMPMLKLIALLFMLPGMGGLIVSTMVSTNYLDHLPKVATTQRHIPRNVHGVTVYQSIAEDEKLTAMEYSSVAIFLIGLFLGVLYLEKWTSYRKADSARDIDLLEEAEA